MFRWLNVFGWMDPWKPKCGETPREYVERVGGRKNSNMRTASALREHYGMSEADSKRLWLQSRSFWRSFFLEHIEKMFDGNGSRFGAVNYVRRKNDPLGNGKLTFTDEEIEALVDSVGEWKR